MPFAKRKISNLSSRDERVIFAIVRYKSLQNDYAIEKRKKSSTILKVIFEFHFIEFTFIKRLNNQTQTVFMTQNHIQRFSIQKKKTLMT